MTPFRVLTAPACPLALANVDTDQLIPARFMKRSRAEGYGALLLHDMRFDAGGRANPDFPLNDPRFAGAGILVTRRNFGAGSSREAAVYALADYGIRCVVAPTFSDIFASNAVNNGLLPARVSEADAEALIETLQSGGTTGMEVDLEEQNIRWGTRTCPFLVDPVWRLKLLNGWDDIDLTLQHLREITDFAAADRIARPWAIPRR